MKTMKITRTILSTILSMSASAALAAGYTQNGNFITVQLQHHVDHGPSFVRLQVVSDHIIRVESTAEQAFPQKNSLMIVPQRPFTHYQVSEENGIVMVKKLMLFVFVVVVNILKIMETVAECHDFCCV